MDDGFASIEIYGTGEVHYNNRLNKNASWSMELTAEQLLKVKELENIYNKINKKNTYKDIFSKFTDEVKEAWKKAEADAGTNGFGMDTEGNIEYLSEFAKKYMVAAMSKNETENMGNTLESMLKLAKEMLERLNDSSQPDFNKDLQKLKNKEKIFYENLIQNLSNL